MSESTEKEPANKSTLACILTDVHLWVPVIVLILGTALLMSLR
ncbi:MAG TPA: hypothetical protein VMD55_08775 [Terracidiphilus sp.]|nr:hypothetical protein [Terracidiphilus sp.]